MKDFRECPDCKEMMKIPEEIGRTGLCLKCRDKRYERQKAEARLEFAIRECIGCGADTKVEPKVTFTYCGKCREKRKQNKILTVERYFNGPFFRTCYVCDEKEEVADIHTPTTYICKRCVTNPQFSKEFVRQCWLCEEDIVIDNKLRTIVFCNQCKELKKNFPHYEINGKTYRDCFKCGSPFEKSIKSPHYKCEACRKVTKNKQTIFGRKKHFGYYGTASDGHSWWSLNEQDVEEWLTHNKIEHEPHKRLGTTLKHSDQYLPDYDIYIEIDGLSRKDDIDWFGKLSLYEKLGLKLKIVTPVETHFHQNKQECFKQLDKKLDFIT